ncbi:hypothetical protein [Corticicoccus populi]|uniref:Uncharacterized protein n=1 Tax=Corticicoccus populi TaxID=1812821 RepID=A0ABW5WQQ9_9STAP
MRLGLILSITLISYLIALFIRDDFWDFTSIYLITTAAVLTAAYFKHRSDKRKTN